MSYLLLPGSTPHLQVPSVLSASYQDNILLSSLYVKGKASQPNSQDISQSSCLKMIYVKSKFLQLTPEWCSGSTVCELQHPPLLSPMLASPSAHLVSGCQPTPSLCWESRSQQVGQIGTDINRTGWTSASYPRWFWTRCVNQWGIKCKSVHVHEWQTGLDVSRALTHFAAQSRLLTVMCNESRGRRSTGSARHELTDNSCASVLCAHVGCLCRSDISVWH